MTYMYLQLCNYIHIHTHIHTPPKSDAIFNDHPGNMICCALTAGSSRKRPIEIVKCRQSRYHAAEIPGKLGTSRHNFKKGG